MDPQVQEPAMILGSADPAPFETIISHLMSSSNEQRSAALFNFVEQTYPDYLSLKLLHVLLHSPSPDLRARSAVLLHKLLTPGESYVYPRLSLDSQSRIKSSLRCEDINTTLKRLCDIVSELATSILADNGWPKFLPLMFQCISSGSPKLQEASFLIFAQFARSIGSIRSTRSIRNILDPYINELHGAFFRCLGGPTGGGISNGDVKIAALNAFINFIQCLSRSTDRDRFQDLFPAMMRTLRGALNNGQEATAQEALELLVESARTVALFWGGVDNVGSMLQIAEDESLEEGTRHLAIKFVITLAERAPGMMRELPQFISMLFAILMEMLSDIEDEPVWHGAETEDEDAGETSNYRVGQEYLDRLSISLGGNTIVPVACEQLAAYLAAPEWQKSHAALIAIAQIAVGHSELMIQNLDRMVLMVLNSFHNPHPRVRWAAINAIGQLSTKLGPDLRVQYRQQVLPALTAAMDDFQNPRVQVHAALGIFNFSETPNMLKPYLDAIARKLLELLQRGKQMVRKVVLTALASKSSPRLLHAFVSVLRCPHDRCFCRFQDLLPAMMHTLTEALNNGQEATAQEVLELLMKLAGTEPRFLRQLVDVVGSMLQIAEDESLEEGTRHLATKFVITLAEAGELAPGMMREFISRLFAILMKMLLDIKDEPVWHGAEAEDGDAGETSNYRVGQEYLGRLSISLGGNTIVPVATEQLPAYLAAPEWQKRHAALIAIAKIAVRFSEVMIQNLDRMVSMVLNSFDDPHPRVRWAAINAIGQLSSGLGPDLQVQDHELVLVELVAAMDDFQNPQIQAHAALAIINFSKNCTVGIIAPSLNDIARKLVELLELGTQTVRKGVLTALASEPSPRLLDAFVFVLQCRDDLHFSRLQYWLEAMMHSFREPLNNRQEATAQEALELLMKLAGTEPRFLKRRLVAVLRSMLQIAEAESQGEGTRRLAIMFMITLGVLPPGMMELPQFISMLFAILMRTLLDFEDEPVWHGAETEDKDAGEASNYWRGQQCLKLLSVSVGGNTIVPVASEQLPAYLAAPEWPKRYAALIAIAQIAEGHSEVSMMLNSFDDPRLDLGWAAINAIGQFLTGLGPDLRVQNHERVLEVLAAAMDNF